MIETSTERLPIAEAARQLSLSPKTLRRHAQQGTIPPELSPEKTEMGWYLTLPTGYVWPVTSQGSPRGTSPSAEGRSEVAHGSGTAVAQGTPAVEVAVKAAVAATADTWRPLLNQALDRASSAEQAAAMWQERARNLEGEVGRLQELLALPAHEEEPPRRRWWQWWAREG
ncbi:MAG: hypothetical protein ACR2JY_15915 [Chloroflexota bacterium]